MKKFELTNPQKSIWVTEEFYKGTSIENIGGSTIIHDKVDFEKLKKAINLLVQNHDSLRLRFVSENNTIKQYISDFEELKLNVQNVESEKDVKRIEKEFVNTPFDVLNSLLFRFQLYKFKDGHGGFVVIVHHLIADAWGSGIIISEIINAYNSLLETNDYTRNTTSYLDYISSEEEYLASPKFEKDEAFWQEEYSLIPELATIPGSVQSKELSCKAKRKVFKIPSETMDFINSYCKENKISPFNFFMGAYSIYLSRVTGLDEFVIGTPVLNRSNTKEKHTIGMFISVVPFKVNINHEESFSEFASRISSDFFSIFRHQKYPYQMLLENLRKQNSSIPNLYSVILSYQNMRTNTKNSKTPYETTWLFNGNVGDDMEIHFFDINDSGIINVAYDYKTSKYSAEDIYAIHSRLLHIMNQILGNNNLLLKDIEIVTPDEKNEILYKFNHTKMEYPKDKTIVQIFEEQVEKTPDNIAVVFEQQKLTYKELNEKANSLAECLKANCSGTQNVIGIHLEKNIDYIISIIATLKSGNIFLPISTLHPKNRIEYILKDSKAKILISNCTLTKNLNYDCLYIDIEKLLFKDNFKIKEISKFSNDIAYILYTSGSTGNPKGVKIKNYSLVNHVYAINNKFNNAISINDNCLSIANTSFDASIQEIFIPLLLGATLHVLPDYAIYDIKLLANYIHNSNITFAFIPPNILDDVYEFLEKYKKVQLNKLLVGVEKISFNTLNKYLLLNSNMNIHNGYGPTEATICCISYMYNNVNKTNINGFVPIGSPLANNKVLIIDANTKRIQPIGVPGEIIILGDQVSDGYTDEKLNNSYFLCDYFNEKAYRTGDFGYFMNDGNIVFSGRKDNQVKINGHRIELLEIDNVIQGFRSNIHSVTLVKNNKIISFLTSKDIINVENLKEYLKFKLPTYMLPYKLLQLEKLPITKNGKVNTKDLLNIEIRDNTSDIVLPSTKTENQLYITFSTLLNINKFSITDSFFDLGGDSLAAIRLSVEINHSFDINLSVQDIFKYTCIKDLAAYIDNISHLSIVTIPRIPDAEFYLASSAQKRMYFASSVAGQSSILYNISGGVILDGEVDHKKLEECFKILILRHESLRTYFEVLDGQVVQKVLEKADFKLDVLGIQNVDDLHTLFEDFVRPFNLSKAPLFRTKLVKFTNKTCALFVDMHHIISDGTSLSILIDELCKLYNDEVLPELNITYKDFATFENRRLISGDLKDAENYWVHQFEDEVPQLNLPTKNTRPAVQSFEGQKVYSTLSKNMVNKIYVLSKELGVTPYMVMLGAYYILLSKYTSQEDIVIGTPVVGRDLAETYNLIGMFVNTLALREKINSKLTFKEFLNKLKENLLNSYKYQTYPFDELVNKLEIKRDTSRNPLFDTMFIYQNNGFKDIYFNNIKSEYYVPDTGISKFDLSLEVIPNENGAQLSFEYATKLFDEEFIKAMSGHYKNILNNILENVDTKISEIEMLSEEEKNKILYEFNNTQMDYPKDKTIVQLFEEQVVSTPEATAVVFEDQKITYKELNEKANSLAHYLKSTGISKNDVVAIMLKRSFETIIAILATLKSGGIYTLIDHTFPAERINYILKNSMAELLITDANYDVENIKTLDVSSVNYVLNTNNLDGINNQSSDDFAIIYTSGSTGNPKGVLLHNNGLVNLIYSFKNILNLSSSKRQLGFAAVSFDMFTVELFSSILLGRTLYLLNEEESKNPILISNIILKNNIDFLICTPSKLELLLTNNNISKCLKQLKGFQLGGEVFTPELYKKISKITDAQIYNGYGPTEITACCSNKHVKSEIDINIGTPIPNMKIYILDKDFNLCPTNVPGELCVSGVGVSHGYIFDDEKTSKVFVKSKFNDELLYKTGDIAYYNSNGELQYIGRNDFQVKINGLRIELSEIEKQFCNITDVESCVVVADETKSYLKAFFVAKSHLSIPAIRIKLAEKLPAYMIPRYIEQLDSIPITNNGKIDRLALDILVPKIENNLVTYVEPETDLQRNFCTIWENILGTKVGIDNDLFELGADSLTAIKFKVEALDQGIDIPYADIFKYKTVRNLCTSKTQKISTTPIENFDYTNINKLLNKNKLQLNYKFNINKNNHVLLLGSNGFVGMHIIDSFIKNDSGVIYCLMRDKNGKGALNRFLEVLHFYFGNTLDSYIGNRIIVLKGDILKENFGLSQRNYNKIIDDVSTVINTAANVKHFGDFNKFKNINIDSIKRTIDFCELYSKKLIHISTLSISGNMFLDNTISKEKLTKEKKKYFSEKNLFIMQSLDNVYTRSKFEAEKIVLENISSGKINGLVLRLGNITSRYSDGRFQINPEDNAFTSRLKSFVALGFIPKSLVNKEIEFTPVDLCADSIIKCLQYSNNTTSVLHIYNRHHIKINLILNVLREFNLPIKIVNDNNFSEYINNILSNKSKKLYINGIANDLTIDRKLTYDSNIYIKSDFSVNYLLRCNFKWSRINRDYVIKYITYLKSINFFTKD